jgi:Uma2 family endonuclease
VHCVIVNSLLATQPLAFTIAIMTIPQPVKKYSPREYYELEQAADYKSDYYRGEIFAMAGGTIVHSAICTNITGELRGRLKGKRCRPYESNLRLKIKFTGLRCYPDASLFCDPFEYDEEDPNHETVTNPTVIFEVLSPSTEGYDRGFKSENYRRIPSLKAYALVSQEKPHVEIYQRQTNGAWLFDEQSGLDANLCISSIDVDLPLAEIYASVAFTDAETTK